MFKISGLGLETLCLFIWSLIIFSLGLHAQEVIGFESRFYLFLLEMFQHGPSIFPTAYGEPYPDYPVTSTLVMNVFAHLLGGVNKFTAVVPTAIAASLTLVVTYLCGELYQKRLGLYAVLFLLLTVSFLKAARSISLDMYPTLITATAFYFVYKADKENKPSLLNWVYLLFVLGFMLRGPIGLVMPTGVVCVYYLLSARIKTFFSVGGIASLLLILCTLILLGLAYQTGGSSFVQDVMRMQVLGRIDHSDISRGFYFMRGLGSYALSFPAALLVLLGLAYYALRQRKIPDNHLFFWQVAAWMLVILIGMTIPGDKKIRYILPMAPAAALLAAYPFVAPKQEAFFLFLKRIYLLLFSCLPLLFLTGIIFLYFYSLRLGWSPLIPYFLLISVLLLLQAIAWWHYQASIISIVAVSTFLLMTLTVIEPIDLHVNQARRFITQVESERHSRGAALVFYKERPDGLPIKYLINMPKLERPLFIETETDLEKMQSSAFFITSEHYFTALAPEMAEHYRIVAKDKMAHVKVVVFTRA